MRLRGAAGIGQDKGVVIDLHASVGALLVDATRCAACGEGWSRRYGMVLSADSQSGNTAESL
jgi:hypothetical protein